MLLFSMIGPSMMLFKGFCLFGSFFFSPLLFFWLTDFHGANRIQWLKASLYRQTGFKLGLRLIGLMTLGVISLRFLSFRVRVKPLPSVGALNGTVHAAQDPCPWRSYGTICGTAR